MSLGIPQPDGAPVGNRAILTRSYLAYGQVSTASELATSTGR